ncbi:hypothetical protein AVEN_128513-1 [Araneus ventricosus]|uniref:Uncharacterized protein n=1 Tax=Araneus ventricosus TaxID=182803 RepID=A0A4Y2HP19_ARAVE|nr:hypothetical protein AVEN_128513-1 [Araneus ventricosus]
MVIQPLLLIFVFPRRVLWRCIHNNCCSDSANEVLDHPAYSPDMIPSIPTPEKVLAKQHFPCDDDVQTDSCHRLALLSGGESLRYRCIAEKKEIQFTMPQNVGLPSPGISKLQQCYLNYSG